VQGIARVGLPLFVRDKMESLDSRGCVNQGTGQNFGLKPMHLSGMSYEFLNLSLETGADWVTGRLLVQNQIYLDRIRRARAGSENQAVTAGVSDTLLDRL
jgi:hypothetical protein